jgi:hypothetical protein
MTICAAFWFERRTERRYLQPKPDDHIGQNVIGEKAQTILHELNRNMSVSKVICSFCDQKRVVADRLEQGFVDRHDLDIPAVLELHPLSAAQQPAPFDDQGSLLSVVQPQEQSTLTAGIESQVSAMTRRLVHRQNKKYR